MNIYGDNILLRAIEPDDNDLLKELINDPDIEKMIGGSSFPVSSAAQAKWIDAQIGRTNILRCIVAQRNDPQVGLGTVILSDIDQKNGTAQVHIKLSKHGAQGKGYGTQALRAIVKYAFEQLRLNCIYAEVLLYNAASKRIFEKCGFSQDGILRSRVYKGGEYHDVLALSIIRSDSYEG